jgi:hypothetical protein
VVLFLKKSTKNPLIPLGAEMVARLKPRGIKSFCALFSKSAAYLLIPTVINNDRRYKPLFFRVAAPPAPRAIPTALED